MLSHQYRKIAVHTRLHGAGHEGGKAGVPHFMGSEPAAQSRAAHSQLTAQLQLTEAVPISKTGVPPAYESQTVYA